MNPNWTKRLTLLAAIPFLLCSIPEWLGAEVIAQWTFNNSVLPSEGAGEATLTGGTTASFATGSTNDPASTGNTGWNTTQYPTQGTANKTAGVRFSLSTLGYAEIVIHWDHRVSGSASKYCRFQYSTDGSRFTDLPGPIASTQVSATPSFYEPQTADLAGVPGTEDNPDFAFRIVSEFESTALGSGAEAYVTTHATNRYSPAGTIRLDMVTVTGNPVASGNLPPSISIVADQTLRLGQATGPLAFITADAEDAPDSLQVTASSSNVSVVPQANIALSGAGSERFVEVRAGDQAGASTISLRVTDSGGRSSISRFVVSVLPANTDPFISAIPGTNLVLGREVSLALPFTVSDLETPAEDLTVAGQSGNPALLPNDPAHITFGGTGSNRFVALTPVAGVVGASSVAVVVSDGVHSNHTSFPLAVTPAVGCLLFESFSYLNGAVVTNSGLLWTNHSGTPGDCELVDGQLRLTSNRSEDVLVPLPGAPYEPGQGQVLYAAFRIKFAETPRPTPEYFAHFFGESSSRARAYAGAADVWPGAFRLYVANGSATMSPHAAVLSTNTYYTVVLRHNLDLATTALWVSPASESTPAAIAIDAQAPVSITAFGFRQESALGTTVMIDDLRAGLSFAAVTTDTESASRWLHIEPANGVVRLWWIDPASSLQAAPNPGGPFTNLAGAASPFTTHADRTPLFFRLYRAP